MRIDKLCEAIKMTQCPVCAGLDTEYGYLPPSYREGQDEPGNAAAAACVFRYNCDIIDAIADTVPSVKVQSAYYEQYGAEGIKCFFDTMAHARQKGLIVIADAKRNDIGSTAAAYARAHLIKSPADFLTVNAYFGIDGIKPFMQACEKSGKGIFVLVKTSNPSGGEFQDLDVADKKLYEIVAEKVALWGEEHIGRCGYSSVGAVVGATYPKQARELRERLPHTFFLVPGYGAQGAGADDIAVNFDANGLGAVVNSSRGILLAYKSQQYAHLSAPFAARAAVQDMKKDIIGALARRGIVF